MNSAVIIISTVMSSFGAIALIVIGMLLLKQAKTSNGKAMIGSGWAYLLIILGALLALTTWLVKIAAATTASSCSCGSGSPSNYGYYRFSSYS